MAWREDVAAEAKTWIGTPYVPKGRVKHVGVDCGGLLYEVYNPHFGPFAPFPTDYSPDWCVHQNNELYLKFIDPYVHEVSEVRLGGFSLYHMGLNYAHAAIYIGNGKYVHSWGRQRAGGVTTSTSRILHALGKGKVKHFDFED